MRGATLLFCCALIVGFASAEFVLPTIGQQVVQVWSDWYFISERSLETLDTFSVTIRADPNDMDITPSTLTFNNVTRERSFRLRPQSAGDYSITFLFSDGDYDVRFVRAVNRTISIEGSFTSTFYQGFPSEPYQVRLNYPSEDEIRVTPVSSSGKVTFNPSTIVIPAGAKAAPFRITVNEATTSSISYSIAGSEILLYAQLPVNYIYSVAPKDIYISTLSSFYLLGVNSTQFYVWAPLASNSSITVTPTAVDTQFSPSSVQLSASTRYAPLTFVSNTSASGSRSIFFDVSGSDTGSFVTTEVAVTGITKKTITVQAPVDFVLNKKTHVSVRLAAPVVKDLTVYLYAGNLAFSPTSVIFKADTTAVVVEVTPTDIGNDVITFKIDGTDKDFYTAPADKALVVTGGMFTSPSSWYVPLLWLNVASPAIPVRVSVPPKTNVVLIPQAPDMIFTPSRLTFNANTLQQSFNITPVFTNKAATDPTVTSVTISFIIDGGDYLAYSPPAPFAVTVSRRSVQFKWSAHLTETTANVKDLYLGKQYELWATALYAPPSDLTITPTNSYVSFEPSVIQFSPTVTHVKVIATVNATVGSTFIDWIVGGKDGGHYTVPTPQAVRTSLRPLGVYRAQIAPDDRVYPGVVLDTKLWPTLTTYMGLNHVYWFSLWSNVIPDKSLTVTPRSKHIIFDPPSYTLTFGESLLNLSKTASTTTGHIFMVPDLYVGTANFSVGAQAPGTHEVWFELTGEDAQYYDIPDNVWVMSTQELRLASERSAATTLTASLLALAVSFAVTCMLM